jgi:hypothetical protein
MLYIQNHELNARNMHKDDNYCRRLAAWNDFISRDFASRWLAHDTAPALQMNIFCSELLHLTIFQLRSLIFMNLSGFEIHNAVLIENLFNIFLVRGYEYSLNHILHDLLWEIL